ncbi:MAG: alpha/beta hydrolase family esterase [Gemmatimonadaceae bacterium]
MLQTFLIRLLLGGILASTTASVTEFYTHETAPGDYLKKVDVDGRAREYLVHVPAGYDGKHLLPLLFAFHGSSASARVIEQETGLDERADSLGFIVVYPEGLHRAWNIGECCRYSFKQRVDETKFVSAIMDVVERGFTVDSTRVYAVGYSDGGTLSYMLACKLPNRLTAVAGVAATLFKPEPACDLPRSVPVMIVHGTADVHVRYGGSTGGPPDEPPPHFEHSAPEVAQFWTTRDVCLPKPEVTRSGNVTTERYQCRDSSEVLFYTIKDGAHGWPGGSRGWIFSPVPPRDMVATDSVLTFFLRYRLGSSDSIHS